MAYTTQNKAHSNHYITKPDGSTASRYSRYEVGRITGRYREIPAVLADSTGFDSLGFDSSVGSVDDSWHVVNVFDSVNNYIDSMAIGGAMDGNHALQIAKSQLDSLGGTRCQLITNNAMQFDGMDQDHAWSIDAINKLMDNPSQNKSYLPVITAPELVVEAERVTFDSVQWDSNDNLISHGGKGSRLYLDLTRADTRNELVTEFDLADALFDMDAEEAGFDALMDTKSRLPLLKDRLFKALSRAGDESLSVTNVTQTKEFKRQGVINIAFVFDLSDGQKLSIWFHKPLESSSKLLPSDYMVSWKWMLNKRDVTAALSPKHGDNVQLPALARRIMRVAAKNSKRFKAAQARKAKVEQELLDAEQAIEDKKATISQLDADIADLNSKIDAALQERKDEGETEKAAEPEKPKGGDFSEGDDMSVSITDDKVTKGSVNESTTVKGTKISSNFALVEAKKLITSHDAAGVANPDFPQALQPRDRSDKKSVEAIKANAKKLQPEKLGQTDRVGNGAPIVGDDLIVESGNGRAMAVKLAYDNGDAENYRAWLIENASEFGFSGEQVEAYKQPVLVRVRTTAVDRMDFAIEANQDGYPQYFDNEENDNSPASTTAASVIPIREALEYVKTNIFKGKDDQVLMYVTDKNTGGIKESKLVKASSQSAQTRWSNKFIYDDTTGSVYNQSIPKTNINAATLLEDLGYKIDYADPEDFIDDQFKVGDAYRFIDPNDANDTGSILEFKSWEGINRGNDEPILSFSSFSGASAKSFRLSEMQKLVADGAAVLVTESEAQEAKDFETEQPVSVYVNSKGRELVTVTYSYGQYNLKGNGFMSGADDEAGVLKLLRSIRKDNKSMKLKEGKDFFPVGDDGKEYPPLEYDAESKTVTAYMNSKKKDSWMAIPKDDGSFTVYADNAQTRAYRTSAPKMFDNSEDLIATYPAFRGIDALLAKHSTSSDDADYDEIDSSEYPQMFLDRNKDKLNILGIGDDDIHVGLEDDYENKSDYSDLYHIDSGLFARQTLNFADAVCKTVDAAISLGADAVVGDFTATAYQDSMFDGLDSKSNPTYGITVQIEKGGVYLRAEIDAYGECKILKGASGTDVIATIKHVFTDNTNEYQSALADALDIQVDDDMSTTDTHDAPNLSVGDKVVWRNDNGELRGIYRGEVDGKVVLVVNGSQMEAPADEVFADDQTAEPVAEPEPATSAAADRINEIEQQMSAADFDPMTIDTDELIDLVDQVDGDADLSAKLDAISVTLQQKMVAISMKALTDMAGA